MRTHGFLSCVLPYTNTEWEKRSIFLNFEAAGTRRGSLFKDILDAIDMNSYRVEKRAVPQILPPDEDAEVDRGRPAAAATSSSLSATGSAGLTASTPAPRTRGPAFV